MKRINYKQQIMAVTIEGGMIKFKLVLLLLLFHSSSSFAESPQKTLEDTKRLLLMKRESELLLKKAKECKNLRNELDAADANDLEAIKRLRILIYRLCSK